VVDPSTVSREDEGAARVVGDWPGTTTLLRPALVPGDGPRPHDPVAADGVVVLGSAASVHDPLPWLADLAAWLEPLVTGSAGVPVLGICFGHQLVAHLAGGEVVYAHPDRRKTKGVEETVLEGGRLLPGRHVLRVVVSHREVVSALPSGFRVTASRPGVPVDGLEHVSLPVFGVQFHPEARREFAARRGFDPELVDDRVHADGERLLAAFRRLVLETRG
jgi:GMP synthase-like glutamine amidotransferase